MRAVRLFAPRDVRCVEVERPQIEKNNDVIIKVKACGVCGSDIMRVAEKGTYSYPITIGHEFAGDIVSIGNRVQNLNPGERVTVMPLIHCGYCNYCRVGEYALCDNYKYYGSRIDGAMAEYIRVKADNVLKLPNNVDYEAGAMTDPVAVALHAVRKIKLEPGQQVVLLGIGSIGFLALQWLKTIGAGKVYVVDVFDEKLKQAESFGADYVINGKKQDVANVIMEQTNGEGVDAVIELAGNKVTQVQAIQVIRKMGIIV
ncbi:MAG: galactitol-1-phosphate 5-dehydrogenase, partial [Firmicutes bacterium HGW-Firmicutes-18]